MTLDADGRLTVAGHAGRTVWRLESLDPKAQVTVLVGSYRGKKLNSPNDDPPYGLPQSDSDPKKELQGNGIYRIPNARRQKPGAPPARDKLQLVIKDRERPNGIAFSPDEKFVYIAECHESVLRRAEVGEHRRVAEFLVTIRGFVVLLWSQNIAQNVQQ